MKNGKCQSVLEINHPKLSEIPEKTASFTISLYSGVSYKLLYLQFVLRQHLDHHVAVAVAVVDGKYNRI